MAVIVMIVAAFLGYGATFLAWMSHGILLALVLAPFGGSMAALIAGLSLPRDA